MTNIHAVDDLEKKIKALESRLKHLTRMRDYEDRYEKYIANAPVAVFVSDERGAFLEVNKAAQTLTGYSHDEMLALSITDLIHPSYVHKGFQRFIGLKDEGGARDAFLLMRKDGSSVHVVVDAIRFNNGQYLAFCTETENSGKKEFSEKILQNVPSAVFSVNKNRIITSWNKRAEEITGYKATEIIGKKCTTFAENPCRTSCGLFDQKIGKPLSDFPCTFKTKDGRLRNAEKNVDYLRDTNGRVVGGIEIFEDVTHRLEKDKKLIQVMKAVDTSDNGIGIADLEGKMQYVNPALENLFGYSLEDYHKLGGSPGLLILDNDLREQVDKANESGQSWSGELQMRDKDGMAIDVFLRVDVIRDEQGRSIGYMGIHTDVSEKKDFERKLREYMKKLESSNAELEQFAYIASHDLQEPLRKIQAFSDRLQHKYKDVIDDRGRDYMERMNSAAGRMQEMINDLLSYSRLTTRKNAFAGVDLNLILEEVLSDLETRIDREKGNVEIQGHFPVVQADKVQMRQVFANIIGNGLKYCKPDVPPVILVNSQRENGICRISVRDNGIGFSQEHAEKIFQPFMRLHGRSKYEGNGIGLAIVNKIVQRHNGQITANSEPGKGSEFVIEIPLEQPRQDQ
ncbi:MAG: PAS domain S-box protein [Bacteroidales bacterium]